MNKKIPAYLTERGNLVKMLIFTAIFSMVFINIYKPFGSEYWKEITQTEFFLLSSVVVVAGLGILSLSRWIMYRHVLKKTPLLYWQYFTWIVSETAVIALIYTFLTKFPFHLPQDFISLFSSAFLYTLSILLFPYLATWLYFALQNAEKVIEAMTREENFVDLNGYMEQLIHFKDEKDKLRFSAIPKNILYIESDDNYVKINYLAKSKPNGFLLRNSLSALEGVLDPHLFVRCHRSYIVNVNNVKMLIKDKEGIYLELDIEGVPDIPVSKTYAEKLMQLFPGAS